MTDRQLLLLILCLWTSLGALCWSLMFLLDWKRGVENSFEDLLRTFLTCLSIGPFSWIPFSHYLLFIMKKKGVGEP